MNYIVLDLEFNQGFDFINNKTVNTIPSCRFEIIQIGALKIDEKFNVIDKLNIYIKPTLYKKIHPFVEKITGLTNKFLKDKPTFKESAEKLQSFIKADENTIFCVWGTSDLRALYRNLSYYKILKKDLILKYIDVQNLATKHLKYSNGSSVGLEKAIELLQLPKTESFHNALNDAVYTTEIFKIISQKTKIEKHIKIFNSKSVPKK